VKVTHVLSGGAAQRAGLSAGDELLALDGWRLRRLDDALRLRVHGGRTRLLVSRDQRVLSLPLVWPDGAADTAGAVSLSLVDKPAKAALARRKAWLAG
jgi:predicted metalloprotease with PDZ domain